MKTKNIQILKIKKYLNFVYDYVFKSASNIHALIQTNTVFSFSIFVVKLECLSHIKRINCTTKMDNHNLKQKH
jgi:hypothetical protein